MAIDLRNNEKDSVDFLIELYANRKLEVKSRKDLEAKITKENENLKRLLVMELLPLSIKNNIHFSLILNDSRLQLSIAIFRPNKNNKNFTRLAWDYPHLNTLLYTKKEFRGFYRNLDRQLRWVNKFLKSSKYIINPQRDKIEVYFETKDRYF